MVDEDFVLGYVTGYNDGAGSGGGVPSGDTVIFKDVTIAKQWNLSGTPFGIALFDVHSDRLICGEQGMHILENLYGTEYNWDRLFLHYWAAMGLMYNGNIVTVNPLKAVVENLIINGAPGRYEYATEIKRVIGTATLERSSTTSSSGTVTHSFDILLNPGIIVNQKQYRLGEIISEAEITDDLTSFSVLTWKFTAAADGTKQMTAYDPYWFFFPEVPSYDSASYLEKGNAGVPKGTSVQQLFQTGLLEEIFKESLLSAGENVTLEEVI